MPTKHFKQWAEYFFECYKETQEHPEEKDEFGGAKHPGYWKYFMMSNLVFMATRRKVGAEKVKFGRDLLDAPTPMDKVKVFLSDPKLVEFAKQLAKDLYSNDTPIPMKSKHKTIHALKKGDQMLDQGNQEAALDLYNVAMTAVPQQKVELLLEVYQKRAQVLVEMGRFNEAMDDIDAIVLNELTSKETSIDLLEAVLNYSNDHGWDEVIGPAEALLQMVREGDEYKKAPKGKRTPIPQSADKFHGEHLDGSSDAFKLCLREGKGRCLVADRDIEVGEPILMEKAFSNHLFGPARADYCYNCVDELNGRFEACLNCNEVRFCSEFCREESWNHVHKHECGYVHAMEFLTSGCDALRAAMAGGHEQVLEEFRNPKPLEYWTTNRLTNDYKGYASLFAHCRNVPETQLISFLFQSAVAAEFALLLKVFPEHTDLVELTTILFINILRNKTNSWALYDSLHRQCGSAVFISFSMPNHSCEPNSHQVYYGSTMASNAVRPIKEGEEVTMSYGPSATTMDVTERQTRLRAAYDFECDCNGCMRDLSRYSTLNYDIPAPDFRKFKRRRTNQYPVDDKYSSHELQSYPVGPRPDQQPNYYQTGTTVNQDYPSYGSFQNQRQAQHFAQFQQQSGQVSELVGEDLSTIYEPESVCETASPPNWES